MSTPPIQILGAGLTGMTAGRHLDGGFEIHERQSRVGGHAVTVEESGYRFDRTGHLLHLRHPEIRRWVEEMLGPEIRVVRRRSRVFSHGVYTRYPYQANTHGLPPRVAYECLYGYLEALVRRGQTPEPENFEQFCLKYFGEGFSRHFMIPYNTKLWGVPPREITAEWCSRFVPRPTLEDVVAGAVGLHDRELGYNAEFLYPALGIGALSDTIAAGLREHIRLQRSPRAVNWRERKLIFDDDQVPYRALISTIPLDTLIRLLDDPPPSVAEAGKKLRCNPLFYLDAALDAPCGVDIHWAYVPEERFPFYRVGCYSHFSDRMAPPGKACLYIELASRREPDLNELMPDVVQGLTEMQFIRRSDDILFVRLRRLDHAYVVFDANYYGALEQIQPFLSENGIISCGRYGGWDYSAMEDAMVAGMKAAAAAREHIK